ncbi:hypothetical protein [Bdellovibrio sp.]|uniref:hypothetical protein n=1 Tax=Bdellovibrio sp. TaxID=28201 RepID=UPI0039E2C529
MQFAVDSFYQAKWSELVESQFVKNVEKKYPATKGKVGRVVSLMRSAIPDYFSEATPETIELVEESNTDVGDIQILAAAIDANCTHLVTYNLKDFDIAFAAGRAVKVLHPDEFFYEVISEDIGAAKASFQKAVDRTAKPPRTYAEYCEGLKKNSLVKTADILLS